MTKKTPHIVLAILLVQSFCANAHGATATGPLKVSAANGRYFTDATGQPIYLTGSHTWDALQDWGGSVPAFNYDGYMNLLTQKNHNFVRLWTWWIGSGGQKTGSTLTSTPIPWLRTGPGTANDGAPKYDLNQPNQAYFDRLRSRVITARDRGIYVSIMLFLPAGYSDWRFNPYNPANNVNGINGDINGDGQLAFFDSEVESLLNPALLAVQRAHVRKVIDSVNDLDNVLYEIINEPPVVARATEWQYDMINYIKSYEAQKAKRHPVGMTSDGGNAPNDTQRLLDSPADWISIGGSEFVANPPPAPVSKVSLLDSDHVQGGPADPKWIWKAFVLGHNPLHMEATQRGIPAWEGQLWNDPANPNIGPSQNAQGYARSYATRMNLSAATPQGGLSSTGFCLAQVGSEYLVYQPGSGGFTVNLAAGTYNFEWFNASAGTVAGTGSVTVAAGNRSFTPPFSGDAALYLKITGSGGGGGGSAQTPYSGAAKPIPGTILTAQYDNGGEGIAYHDLDAANLMSSSYRPGLGVDSNGSGVGWILAGEWLEYTVTVSAAGNYSIAIPVSHPGTGGSMHVSFNGVNATGSLGLPNTGSWSTYQNISATVSLSAGTQVMMVFFDTNGSTGYGPGLGDIVVTSTAAPTPVPPVVPLQQAPFNETPMAIPGTIKVAQYDHGNEGMAFHDIDNANLMSSTYRPGQGVDSEGTRIGWISASEWIEYTVNVSASGAYTISVPLSHPGTGGSMHVSFNGTNVTGAVTLPTTATWDTYQNIIRTVTLNAGTQVMQVAFDTNGSTGYGPGLGDITISNGSGGGGSGATIPGTIAASGYDNGGEGVAYHDWDAANQMSSTFRPGLGVDADAGRGIGWIQAGEWINYTVNVSGPGSYVITVSVCHPGAGGAFHINFNGVNKTGTLIVPNTGSWSANQNISATVNLSGGTQVMQIVFDTNGSTGFTCGVADAIMITPTGSG